MSKKENAKSAESSKADADKAPLVELPQTSSVMEDIKARDLLQEKYKQAVKD